MRLGWLLLVLLPLLGEAGEPPLQLALRGSQGDQLISLSPQQVLARTALPGELQAPLGSLWKLFVYAYLVDQQRAEPPYVCKGQDRDEVYCCAPGESIERDRALAQSCGLYFEPARLQLDAAEWARYWQAHAAPLWLQDLGQLKPEKRIAVAELLDVLAQLPAQEQARTVLLDVLLKAPEGKALSALGGRLRVKTWSWLAEHDNQARQGGFAGWLTDGSPLWVGGPGTSQSILVRYGEVLDGALPTPWPGDAGTCVEVELFSRYPLREVRQTGSAQAVPAGALRGHYEVEFANGNRLPIESTGELFLARSADHLQLIARLSREDYVARVLDREANAQPAEAAKALAIAIRTYLLQSAQRRGECLAIGDSSASQRVAPRPASAAARQIAAWTDDLVLAGSPVTYHSDQPGRDRLAWQQAVEQAASGMRYDAILLRAYPRASLSRWDKPVAACQPLAAAEAWLLAQQRQWRPRLDGEPGYSETRQFAVCQLVSGRPYVDRERRRIFVRGLHSLQDRLDLTHEYLHLAFEAHPNGQDEDYVESLARHLLLE
ncbi:DUF2300 domain-containing protein [Pseudomonas sp. PDM14]|uniref:DUF2300 domain-containing protein n=1 Tax=Pseudomonas sp. PDM14 TaxID=2769288 RepID=UPI0017801017|nr:DUF2300 domain-containing protein [Pseudomonas sp. PDM14]MBD9485452.1 DUF2300 domain-containing protein [Pseudomonas sp. PDM14]